MADTQLNPGQTDQGDPGNSGGKTGQRDAGSQDTPTLAQLQAKLDSLTSDVGKERDRRKAAESKLREKEQSDAINQAKTAEELQALKQQTEADITKMRREADLRVAAADQGIHADFLTAVDDGELAPADVLKAAKERQDAFIKAQQDKTGTMNLAGAGTSPDGGGQRTWKASEIAAMDTATYKKHQDEIKAAVREGRVQQDK